MTVRTSTTAGRRHARIEASTQFNGRVFVNTHPVAPGFKPGIERPTLKDFICGGEGRVPAGPLPIENPVARWNTPNETGLRVTRMGHSTLLIEIDGIRILTDPVWGPRASPVAFAGPKRFHPPPAPLAALPRLDAVIISHDHYDHLDRQTIRALAKTPVPFITSLGVGATLEKWGVPAERITELDWWETMAVRDVAITAAPAQHFSGRGLKDRNATLWSSFHLRGPRHSFLYGADSGLTTEFRDIGARLGPFDMVALEIGAWHPSWGDIHLGPTNAIAAYQMLGSGILLPIHWGTFNLAVHPWAEPAETILRGAAGAGIRLAMPRFGEPIEPSRLGEVDPWWRSVLGQRVPEPAELPSSADQLDWLPD